MKWPKTRIFVSSIIGAGSLLGLLSIVLLTNPAKNVSYALLFFGLLFVLLLSLGHLLVYVRKAQATAAARSKIVIISSLVVLALMFRSGGSLSWIDLLVILLLGFGLLFYSGRRQP